MAEAMKSTVASLLKGIDRYNPDNISTLDRYIKLQAKENTYDLDANLAMLKLYQLNPDHFDKDVTCQILLKALTNLPHTDFVLCKCFIDQHLYEEESIKEIMNLARLLETCQFTKFWEEIEKKPKIVEGITGFQDSIRKFICHVVGITYQTINKHLLTNLLGNIDDAHLQQWMTKYGWQPMENNLIFIANQEENIKPKNIMEKIDFESVAGIMTSSLEN